MSKQHPAARAGRTGLRRALTRGAAIGATALAGSAILAGAASATVTTNPVDANSGFPASITDSADGLTLQPCTINATDCLAARPKPADPLSVGNFPPDGEMFYWAADPVFSGNLAGIASRGTRFAIEGTFTGGKPVDGDQALFARMRFRFNLAPGHYRVTHPFGVETYDVAGTGGLKAVNDTRDYGCAAAPCDMGAIN